MASVNLKWLKKLSLQQKKQKQQQLTQTAGTSLTQSIRNAIHQGAPLYNDGHKQQCYEVYLATAYMGLAQETMHNTVNHHSNHDHDHARHSDEESVRIRALLTAAAAEASAVAADGAAKEKDYDEAAWILRRAFDEIIKLEGKAKTSKADGTNDATTKPQTTEEGGPASPLLGVGDGTDEKERGAELAELANTIEKVCDISDRKFRLKTYSNCFVGDQAVTRLVETKVVTSRVDAVDRFNHLLDVGLLRHVTSDHQFKDTAGLFYQLTPVSEVRLALNEFRAAGGLSSSGEGEESEGGLRGMDLVRYAAVVGRYKQFHKHPSLGVLRLDYDYPPAPGDIDHPDSYSYPVYYRVVPGLTFQMCQSGIMTPAVEKNFDEAVLWLADHQDVSAITGDCGFMMWFIDRVRKIVGVRKPVLLSALMQLPTVVAACAPDDKIIVVTANGTSLDPMMGLIKRQCGVDGQDTRFVFVGCEDVPHFGEPVEKGLAVDVALAQPGIVRKVQEAIAEHPEARMVLNECTELPPYSDAIREATRLPVYDAITNCDFALSGFLDNKAFGLSGWYEMWDGLQEEYILGSELNAAQKLQCVWCKGNEFDYE